MKSVDKQNGHSQYIDHELVKRDLTGANGYKSGVTIYPISIPLVEDGRPAFQRSGDATEKVAGFLALELCTDSSETIGLQFASWTGAILMGYPVTLRSRFGVPEGTHSERLFHTFKMTLKNNTPTEVVGIKPNGQHIAIDPEPGDGRGVGWSGHEYFYQALSYGLIYDFKHTKVGMHLGSDGSTDILWPVPKPADRC